MSDKNLFMSNGGFANISEFADAVASNERNGFFDQRLASSLDGGGTGGQNDAGYLVPLDFRSKIMDIVGSSNNLLAFVDREPTSSNRVRILKDEETPWASTGIFAKWRNEGGRMDPTAFVTKAADIPLEHLYAYTIATEELLEDAPLLASRLTTKAASAIGWTASEAIMWGDGVGKPLGFMRSKALVIVDKEPGQADGTIIAENVAKMYSRLLPSSVRNARWLINSTALPQIMTMKIGSQPIWTPPNGGFADAPGGLLLGRPIELTDHNTELGELGDIVFADLKGYCAPTKASGVVFASSIHLYFDRAMEAFRWTFRVGGQPYLAKPVAPARGVDGKSHFVALQARRT